MQAEDRRGEDRAPNAGRFERLRTELDLAFISFFGGISAIVIIGFAIYRFATGNASGGILDCGISLGMLGIVVYAWRCKDVARAGAIFATFAVVACFTSSLLFGRTSTYWAFLVLSVSFVVTGRWTALIGSLALIVSIGVQHHLFSGAAEQAIFMVSAVLVTVFGWIFSSRFAAQRHELETLAHSDPLTQAGNRRAMRRALISAIDEHRSDGKPAVLAVLDLDHFKAINDRYGHEAGDQVLVDFAEIVAARLRDRDGFFRLGGEEFVVLLPRTTVSDGAGVLEDLHLQLDQGLRKRSIPVTVSAGVAALADDNWSSWLRRADAAMYAAKEAGRNRVIIADSEMADPDG